MENTPSVITGDEQRLDLFVIKDKACKVLELTVGYETNMLKNSKRKTERYKDLITRLGNNYNVEYFDLSMGGIVVISSDSKNLRKMFIDLGLTNEESDYIVRKLINVCLRSTYYIFCRRNKNWEGPSLLAW